MQGDTEYLAGDAQGKSEGAFSTLYERVAPALTAWTQLRTQGPIRKILDPEDLAQDIWWRAIQSFANFDASKGRFRSWLFGIATRTYWEALRKDPKNPARSKKTNIRTDTLTGEVHAEMTSITAQARQNEHVQQLVNDAAHMSREEVQTLVLMGLEGLSSPEAAEIMKISPNAAKKRWQRLREQLLTSGSLAELLAEEE